MLLRTEILHDFATFSPSPMKGSAFVAHNFNFHAHDYFVSLSLYTAPLYVNYIFYVSVCRLNIKNCVPDTRIEKQFCPSRISNFIFPLQFILNLAAVSLL